MVRKFKKKGQGSQAQSEMFLCTCICQKLCFMSQVRLNIQSLCIIGPVMFDGAVFHFMKFSQSDHTSYVY